MKRKAQIVATLPDHVVEKIVSGASRLDVTKSEYLSLIARSWFAKGCPPVSEEEARLFDAMEALEDPSMHIIRKPKK